MEVDDSHFLHQNRLTGCRWALVAMRGKLNGVQVFYDPDQILCPRASALTAFYVCIHLMCTCNSPTFNSLGVLRPPRRRLLRGSHVGHQAMGRAGRQNVVQIEELGRGQRSGGTIRKQGMAPVLGVDRVYSRKKSLAAGRNRYV